MKKQSKLRQIFTHWTWRKGVITSLILFIIGVLGFGGYMFWRVHRSINTITGESQSILDTARAFLPGGVDKQLANVEGRTNILLLGMRGLDDPNGGSLTDSIIILSINKPTNQVAMISIPRDLRVIVPGYTGYRKLNSAHALGLEQGQDTEGLELTMKTLENVTGMPIHYGVTVDFKAFKGMIDALGGITVNAATDFYDPNYEGGIRVKQGPNQMNSDRALKYVWARLSTSDFDRSRRQREVLEAIKDKALEKGIMTNPLMMLNILDSLGNRVKTTMTADEMKLAIETFANLDLDNMIERGYDTSTEGPFTATTDPVIGYVIIPRGGDFSVFQEDIQGIFAPSIDTTVPAEQTPTSSADLVPTL